MEIFKSVSQSVISQLHPVNGLNIWTTQSNIHFICKVSEQCIYLYILLFPDMSLMVLGVISAVLPVTSSGHAQQDLPVLPIPTPSDSLSDWCWLLDSHGNSSL